MGRFKKEEKKTSFTKKDGKLALTSRRHSQFVICAVKVYESVALPTELGWRRRSPNFLPSEPISNELMCEPCEKINLTLPSFFGDWLVLWQSGYVLILPCGKQAIMALLLEAKIFCRRLLLSSNLYTSCEERSREAGTWSRRHLVSQAQMSFDPGSLSGCKIFTIGDILKSDFPPLLPTIPERTCLLLLGQQLLPKKQ